jgi:uncharacterized membrane protein
MARKKKQRDVRAPVQARRPDTPPDRPMLALAAAGLLITAYLTWVAWSTADVAFCSAGSGCDVIQRSAWSTLLGIPMALWGFAAYAVIAVVSLSRKASPLRRWQRQWRLVLVGLAISLYLTVVGALVLDAFCVWCLLSLAVLVAMFVQLHRRRPSAAPGAAWGGWWLGNALPILLLVGVLHVHQSGLLQQRPESRRASALAQHLTQYGAKFYGASWCAECSRQKHRFGSAADELPYVECSPGGRNTPMTLTCSSAGVTVFPTWVIDGRQHTGVLEPELLSVLTRFDWEGAGQE